MDKLSLLQQYKKARDLQRYRRRRDSQSNVDGRPSVGDLTRSGDGDPLLQKLQEEIKDDRS